jgi:transcription initiation factor TFIIH subunit 1
MLKIFSQPANASDPITYTFKFTSPTDARTQATTLRDSLSRAIQAAKTAANGSTNGGTSASLAIAGAVASRPDSQDWEDDDKLKANIELQQSLIKADPTLSKTFMEALRTKPDSLTTSQFTAQFWSSRVNLLRAHAIERSQSKGSYNVLSTIKGRTEDNVSKLNITREQINLIFSQHPLVKRVYDDNVPKLSEETFWTRFFQSRLLKKLKGDRITEADSKDPILDKYLSADEDLERAKRMAAAHVPNIINVEGNEQNHSQRRGNAPDLWMRPTAVERVPIIRTLNSLSEKILSRVAPNDVDPSEPIGIDEATYNSLVLRDLQGDEVEHRLILNVKDQSRFFSSTKDSELGSGFHFERRSNKELRKVLNPGIKRLTGLDLQSAIGVDEDSSESEDEGPSKHMGSRAGLNKASAQVFDAIAEQKAQTEDSSSGDPSAERSAAAAHLSSTIFDRVSLTHVTTTEFLHHFWTAFLSGDPSRTEEIKKLVESLDRAMDRIEAVAKDAEAERMKEIEKEKRKVRDHYERTHKKKHFDPSTIKGGKEAINQLMAPTIEAIKVATKKYAEALAEAGTAT